MPNKETPKKKSLNSLARYSGMGFQLIFLILLGFWLGKQADSYFGFHKPFLAALGAILFLVLGMVSVFRKL